jgi:hypothetical protein
MRKFCLFSLFLVVFFSAFLLARDLFAQSGSYPIVCSDLEVYYQGGSKVTNLNSLKVGDKVTFSVDCSGPPQAVYLKINNSELMKMSLWNFGVYRVNYTFLKGGSYKVEAYGRDAGFNHYYANTLNFTVQVNCPNCKGVTGPSQLTVGEYGKYCFDFEGDASFDKAVIIAHRENACLPMTIYREVGTSPGRYCTSIKAGVAGVYEICCRAWNDGNCECRGDCETQWPVVKCAGPGACKTLTIVDNKPPACKGIAVTPSVNLDQGDTAKLTVSATDSDGTISNVNFYYVKKPQSNYCTASWNKIGTDSNSSDGWAINWNTTGLSAGDYYVTANVVDDDGAWTTGNPGGECGEADSHSPGCVATVSINPDPLECTSLEAYYQSGGKITDFSSLEVGDKIFFTADYSGSPSSAYLRINGGTWQKMSSTSSFYYRYDYTIAQEGDHKIEAYVQNTTAGKKYCQEINFTIPSPQEPYLYCSDLSVYYQDGGQVTDLDSLQAGDQIRFVVSEECVGTCSQSAYVRVNNGTWQKMSRPTGFYYSLDYTIPTAGSYKIEAAVYNSIVGWR